MIGGCQGRAGPRRTGHAGWSGWLVAAGGGRWPGRTGRAGRRGAVQVLRATWIQQFCLDDGQVRWRDKHSGPPPGSRMILNPATSTPGPAANAAAPGVATRRTSPRPVSPTGPPDHPCGTTDAATADLDTVQGRTQTSRPATCCPTPTWSTRARSASADPFCGRRPWRPADRPAAPRHQLASRRRRRVRLTRFTVDDHATTWSA